MPQHMSGPLDRFLVRLPPPGAASAAEPSAAEPSAAEPCCSSEESQPESQRSHSLSEQRQPQCSTSGYGEHGRPGDCSFLSQQLAGRRLRRRIKQLPFQMRHSQLLGRRPFTQAQQLLKEAETQRLRAVCDRDPGWGETHIPNKCLGMNSSGEGCMMLNEMFSRHQHGRSYINFCTGWSGLRAASLRHGAFSYEHADSSEAVLPHSSSAEGDISPEDSKHTTHSLPSMPPAIGHTLKDSWRMGLEGVAAVARWSPFSDKHLAWCGSKDSDSRAGCQVYVLGTPCHNKWLDLGADKTSARANDLQWAPHSDLQLCCSSSSAVHLYDLRRSVRPHASITPVGGGSVGSLQYAPDGTILIGATSKGQVQMWDVRKTGGSCRQLGATGVYQHALLKAFDLQRLMGGAGASFDWQSAHVSDLELLLDPCDPHRLAVVHNKRVAVIDMARGQLTHAAVVNQQMAAKAAGLDANDSLSILRPAAPACKSCWDATGSVLYTQADTVVHTIEEGAVLVPALAALDLSASSGSESPYCCWFGSAGSCSASIGSSLGGGQDADVARVLEMRRRHTTFMPLLEHVTAVCRNAATGDMLVGVAGPGGAIYVS